MKLWWKTHKGAVIILCLSILLLLVGIPGLFRGRETVAELGGAAQVIQQAGSREDGAYVIGEEDGFGGTFLTLAGLELNAGVYEVHVTYEATGDGASLGVRDATTAFRGLRANDIALFSGTDSATLQFYLLEHTQELSVVVDYGGKGTLRIEDITVESTAAGSRIYLFAVCCCMALAALFVSAGKWSREKRITLSAVTGITLLASIPVMVDYLTFGADLGFHLLRIEALKDALSRGIFPARIEPMWLYGHGYANSLFYGDTFLLIPAIFRLIGFSVQTSYHLFVVTVNLATVWIAYVSFQRCFLGSIVEKQARRIGLLGSLLYTLAPYRIYNIYNRGAVGEYVAMTFLPLLVLGFYQIFTEDRRSAGYKRLWVVPVLGFSGIIQSHVLSCEIIGGFTVILCLLLWKKVFRKETFPVLCKVVIMTVLVNLWFLLPFFDMMLSGSYHFSRNSAVTIQKRGILPAHLFYTMQRSGNSSRFHETGMLQTEPVGVGIAILCGIAVYAVIRWRMKRQEGRTRTQMAGAGTVALVLGVGALLMSTSYFPWDWLQSVSSLTGTLIPTLQFPTRLTIVATVCLAFVVCIGTSWVLQNGDQTRGMVCLVLLTGICTLFSMFQTNDILLHKGTVVRIYTGGNLGHSGVLGAEYLPEGADLNKFHYHEANPSDGVTVTDYEKEGLKVSVSVTVEAGADGFVELPLLYYKGYEARDAATKEVFPLSLGTNGDVRVALPAGYSGTVITEYQGMWYFRMTEAVSLLALVCLCLCVINGKRKRQKGMV